jgi:hypothetical protein
MKKVGSFEEMRESVQCMLNPPMGQKQPEGKQHNPSFYVKLVLAIVGIDKRYVRNAMQNEIKLGGGRPINILQHLAPTFGHDHKPGRARDQFPHHVPLCVVRLAPECKGSERI